jgi:hypothetical protein
MSVSVPEDNSALPFMSHEACHAASPSEELGSQGQARRSSSLGLCSSLLVTLAFLQKILAPIGEQTLPGHISGILAGQSDRQEGYFFRFPPPGERVSLAC